MFENNSLITKPADKASNTVLHNTNNKKRNSLFKLKKRSFKKTVYQTLSMNTNEDIIENKTIGIKHNTHISTHTHNKTIKGKKSRSQPSSPKKDTSNDFTSLSTDYSPVISRPHSLKTTPIMHAMNIKMKNNLPSLNLNTYRSYANYEPQNVTFNFGIYKSLTTDDLESRQLLNVNEDQQPRASAVSPISIPNRKAKQTTITLDTALDCNIVNRGRSASHTSNQLSSRTPEPVKHGIPTFSKMSGLSIGSTKSLLRIKKHKKHRKLTPKKVASSYSASDSSVSDLDFDIIDDKNNLILENKNSNLSTYMSSMNSDALPILFSNHSSSFSDEIEDEFVDVQMDDDDDVVVDECAVDDMPVPMTVDNTSILSVPTSVVVVSAAKKVRKKTSMRDLFNQNISKTALSKKINKLQKKYEEENVNNIELISVKEKKHRSGKAYIIDALTAAKRNKESKEHQNQASDIIYDDIIDDVQPYINNFDVKQLPTSLKANLTEIDDDRANVYILDFIRTLQVSEKSFIYDQLIKDKEFVHLLCEKLLQATDAKQNEMVCIWLYDFFKENNPNARLFAFQFIPCLIWCSYTRTTKCIAGIIAALLCLYQTETNIFVSRFDIKPTTAHDSNTITADDVDINVSHIIHAFDDNLFGIGKSHELFNKFEMPDLDVPSIYHEPNSKQFQKNVSSDDNTRLMTAYEVKQMQSKFNYDAQLQTVQESAETGKSSVVFSYENFIKETQFPSLNQATLSTNIHLIHVGLEVYTHYITRFPIICLQQMCAVIAKLCSSGIGTAQVLDFPENITLSWEWQWFINEDAYDGENQNSVELNSKQFEKYILPSFVLCQFLTIIRYSLKQERIKEIAYFALCQVHKRGHTDMLPEIILQTTAMLHSSFMQGLTF